MMRVPGGVFGMGSSKAERERALEYCRDGRGECKPEWFENEAGPVRVEVSPFYIDRDEVSWAAYRRCVSSGGCKDADFGSCLGFGASGEWQKGIQPPRSMLAADHPAMCVSWEDANGYCAWAKKRLPTEAEWELAARGTRGRRFPWGDRWRRGLANVGRWDREKQGLLGDKRDGYLETAPVDAFKEGATPEGVRNLSGNVWEWVFDRFDPKAYASMEGTRDPQGPASGEARTMRGGGWFNDIDMVRGAVRSGAMAASRHVDLGFRCAWSAQRGQR